jgi:hypothetical protein
MQSRLVRPDEHQQQRQAASSVYAPLERSGRTEPVNLATPLRLPRIYAKCQLKPVSRADYTQPLTDGQFARLRAIFPDGVCDYSRRGVGKREPEDTWLAYPRPGKSVRLDPDDDEHGRRHDTRR